MGNWVNGLGQIGHPVPLAPPPDHQALVPKAEESRNAWRGDTGPEEHWVQGSQVRPQRPELCRAVTLLIFTQ